MNEPENLSRLSVLLRLSANASAQKSLLEQGQVLNPRSSSDLVNYSDVLLFVLAYPYSEENRLMAWEERNRIFQWLLSKRQAARWQERLEGSGLPYTRLRCQFSLDLTQWFLERFPEDVLPDETHADPAYVAMLMQLLLPEIEFHDSTQGHHRAWTRIRLLSGHGKNNNGLNWLIRLVRSSKQVPLLTDMLYDQLKIYIRWNIEQTAFSRLGLQWPVKSVHYRSESKTRANSLSIISQRILKPSSITEVQKKELIGLARISLACYYRETDPVTYADSGETFLFDMGEGLSIVLMGMIKERRLALESYIGFMAFKNGIPVSYGGGWIFGHRCKIGVNIYPPFRGAGSDHLFCQVLRLYYQRFRVKKFVVKPYQFGKGNPEGLKSGAFWFYYRLGFRPASENIRKQAECEWEKIQADKSYRTPIHILRSFTACNKQWEPFPDDRPFPEADTISKAITRRIRQQFQGDRLKAIAYARKELRRFLGPAGKAIWGELRPSVIDNWSLLMLLFNDLKNWSEREKLNLAAIMYAQSSGNEFDYILMIQDYSALKKRLIECMRGY